MERRITGCRESTYKGVAFLDRERDIRGLLRDSDKQAKSPRIRSGHMKKEKINKRTDTAREEALAYIFCPTKTEPCKIAPF